MYPRRRKRPVFISAKIIWLTITCTGILLLLASGCSRESPAEMRSYGHDGYMGYSNSNPNTINRHSTLSYREDTALVEQVLAPLNGIRKTRITFNGSRLQVVLKVDKALPDAEVVKLRATAQSLVQSNMPRYDVHVVTKK